ncbi:hypothetical protein GGI15_004666 [Coemansia interrupta]|uniref:Uncharacterized protein n=1 Tax=Coemansia interrupta TaxID=1126814 RepID=A0A9W8H3B3_9FUNG|nr:hypothetical protein GGI15_004666 [Coemansia interrupta]
MSSRLDVITGRMSRLMLKRWTMLAELCTIDGCSAPLMGDPETKEPKCVWHDAKEIFPDELTVEEEKVDEKMDTPELYDLEPDVIPAETPDAKRRRERREQGDSASEKIAKKLLQGWTMIEETCSNESCHNVPLIRDHDMVQFCVICGQKYMDEKTYTKKYGSLEQDAQARIEEPVCNKPAQPPVNEEPESSVRPADVPPSPVAYPGHPYLAICPPKPDFTPSENAATFAIGSLNLKIHDLSARLSATTSVKDIRSISKAIESCAKAISQCQKIQTK